MDTRERILDSAQRLTQTRSFHGFSFQDIADEVGVRKASLYHHFDSKDDVAVAMLQRAADWVSAQFKKAEGREPRERLEVYFDLFRQIHGKGERMCPGGSFASVFSAVSSPVQATLHRFAKVHLDWLEDVVRDGVEQGQIYCRWSARARCRRPDIGWRPGRLVGGTFVFRSARPHRGG
jgi:TetR/AcrR family transcriptional repressor of nem operon